MSRNPGVIFIVTIFFLGCGAAHTVKQGYYPDKKDEAFQKMLVTLQDLGWTVKTTDKESGVISAEKAEKRKRKPEFEASILISQKSDGSDIRVSVSKAGRMARRKVKRQADEIIKHYSTLR